jgi:hypothetical protein
MAEWAEENLSDDIGKDVLLPAAVGRNKDVVSQKWA